ncbi:uncharacterized protein LOC143299397 [Babylonia areolata]|uniref:uncharacterized protein LOC143299397 n=1 Tax=Babylonia areolata TaxID=304850 RepID=UPI003FD37404
MANGGTTLEWEDLTPMPTKRVFATPVFHNGLLYIVGGCDASGRPVDSFEQFDGKKKWKRLLSMPTKRAGAAVVSVGTKIVAIAGVSESQAPLDAVEVYDVEAKSWTALEPLGEPLLGVSAVLRDEKIVVVGGMAADSNPRDMFVEFDLAQNKWKKLPSMPTPRYASAAFLRGDKLYVAGGRQGKLPCVAFEVYDFTEQKWTKLPDIPSKRVFAMYAATDTHVFSVGGLNQPANLGFSQVCEVYDIKAGEWSTDHPDMPTKRGDFAIGVLNNQLICAGGLGNEGKPLSLVESYDVETKTWRKEGDMNSTHCSCAYITHSNRLYVAGGLSLQGPSNCVDVLALK